MRFRPPPRWSNERGSFFPEGRFLAQMNSHPFAPGLKREEQADDYTLFGRGTTDNSGLVIGNCSGVVGVRHLGS